MCEVEQTSGNEVRAGMCYYPIILNKDVLWDENKTASCDVSYLAVYHWFPAPTFRARSYMAAIQMSLSWASNRDCSSSCLLCNVSNSWYSSKSLEEKDNEMHAPVFVIHVYFFLQNPKAFLRHFLFLLPSSVVSHTACKFTGPSLQALTTPFCWHSHDKFPISINTDLSWD